MTGVECSIAMVVAFACNLNALQALHCTLAISRMSCSSILNTYRK
jgi:hypothetical protein